MAGSGSGPRATIALEPDTLTQGQPVSSRHVIGRFASYARQPVDVNSRVALVLIAAFGGSSQFAAEYWRAYRHSPVAKLLVAPLYLGCRVSA